jgi:hypothetical protein
LLDGAHLQGALLYDAHLYGARLDDAQIGGASLDWAHLWGTSLNRAQLQSASIRRAFVWRTDARTADMTDARINSVEIGWKEGITQSFSDPKDQIELIVPEDYVRKFTLERVEIVNPDTPLHAEKQMAEYWNKLQSLSPEQAPYEAKLANQWRLIGCSADGAPYVLAGLIRTMDSAYSPFSSDSVEVPRLAAAFLKDDCAGARGLSDKARAKLKLLRDRAAPGPVKPNTQTQ